MYSAGDIRSPIIYLSKADMEKSKQKKKIASVPEKYRGYKAEIRDLSEYEAALEKGGAVVNG